MLGSPTGLSMKYFFAKSHAIDIGIGFQWWYHAALGIHVDYKFHIYLAKPDPSLTVRKTHPEPSLPR